VELSTGAVERRVLGLGVFVLLSFECVEVCEVLSLYYMRQEVVGCLICMRLMWICCRCG